MSASQEVVADVAVIGAGPAGVTVALELARAGQRVVLLPGGGHREDSASRDLHRAEAVEGPWGHEPLEENRRRAIGGTSALWGGRCVPLEPIDFEARDWVPGSGWPMPYEEYWSWAQRACDILDVGRADFRRDPSADLLTGAPAARRDLDEVTEDSLERWSAPFRFAQLLGRDRDLQQRCEVLVGASAVGLDVGEDGALRAVRARRGDADLVVRARSYVLAAGGLENARLMLHSDLAKTLPALGRYYMTHTVGSVMSVRVAQPLPRSSGFFREADVYLRNRWRLTDAAQRAHGVGNAVAFFARAPATAQALHRDPMTSAVALAKIAQSAARARLGRAPSTLPARGGEVRQHLRILASGRASFWGRAARLTAQRLARHSLPMVLPDPRAPVQHLTFQGEHLPNPHSAVRLGDTRDRLGVPRLRVRVDLSDGDFATVLAVHRGVAGYLRRRGAAPLTTPEQAVADLREALLGGFNSHAHHIGTTRMGTSPVDSVVDADCRVHGVRNLFVAGSSTFPTGGHANPTLSIVMLSARLGHHLAAQHREAVGASRT